ncbi:MAG: hypothetical protein QNJ54_35440 [Prochloraceae cyanobacterium]|nr:hypothetical protein [Prochloraceae cyanobacterium]
MTRLYDTWDSYDRECFNPDGSLTDNYRDELIEAGWDFVNIIRLELRKMNEVKEFERREKFYEKEVGMPYSQYCKQTPSQIREIAERQRLALLEGEELSALPEHIDPDDYYFYRCGSAIYGDDEDT